MVQRDRLQITILYCACAFHYGFVKQEYRHTATRFNSYIDCTARKDPRKQLVVTLWSHSICCHIIFLHFTISVTVTVLRSERAVNVACSFEVLCFISHWLCSTDIAVGLWVWCLKDNRVNRLAVKVWQLVRGFCWFDV